MHSAEQTLHGAGHDVPKAHNPYLADHFQSIEQQKEAATMGMWLFLAQEIMFFGGLFCAYTVYRTLYPEVWHMGSSALNVKVGAFNTIVLLLSSFSMAMGVFYTQTGQIKKLIFALIITLLLGITFVSVKWVWEYSPKYHEGVFPGVLWAPRGPEYGFLKNVEDQGHLQIFFFLYFVMTGMHAFHMLVGFGIILVLIIMAMRGKFGPERYMPIEFFGLYWHFVDIVWVFLFPMYYLVK